MKIKTTPLFDGQSGYLQTAQQENISCKFGEAEQIVVYDDGKVSRFIKGDDKYEMVLKSLLDITENGRQMPAFAVSLDKETRADMQKGFWVELEYSATQEFLEMQFDSLLLRVEKTYSGVNLNRKLNGKYEGRCYYLDLESDMSPLFETLQKISKN